MHSDEPPLTRRAALHRFLVGNGNNENRDALAEAFAGLEAIMKNVTHPDRRTFMACMAKIGAVLKLNPLTTGLTGTMDSGDTAWKEIVKAINNSALPDTVKTVTLMESELFILASELGKKHVFPPSMLLHNAENMQRCCQAGLPHEPTRALWNDPRLDKLVRLQKQYDALNSSFDIRYHSHHCFLNRVLPIMEGHGIGRKAFMTTEAQGMVWQGYLDSNEEFIATRLLNQQPASNEQKATRENLEKLPRALDDEMLRERHMSDDTRTALEAMKRNAPEHETWREKRIKGESTKNNQAPPRSPGA